MRAAVPQAKILLLCWLLVQNVFLCLSILLLLCPSLVQPAVPSHSTNPSYVPGQLERGSLWQFVLLVGNE